MRTQAEIVANLQRLKAEQDHLLRVMEMWAAVAAQGVDVDQVESFVFRPGLFKLPFRMKFQPYWMREKAMQDARVFNIAKLKDGTEVVLDPPVPNPGLKEDE